MHPAPRRLGTTFTLAGVLAGLAYPLLKAPLVALFAALFSADGQVTAQGEAQLAVLYYFSVLMLAAAGLLLWATDSPAAAPFKRLFFEDPLFPGGKVPVFPPAVFVVSTLLGVVLIVLMYLVPAGTSLFTSLYLEDGLFENLTFLAYMIGAICMLHTALSSRGRENFPRWIRLLFLVIALGFFVIGMEEISWGQRVFGWGTPDVFKDTNVQDETNLHNIFNAYFPLLYRVFALFPLPILLGAWLELKGRWLPITRYLLPHLALLGLSVLITFVTVIWNHQELIEELLAVFVVFYGLRLALAVSVPVRRPVMEVPG